MSDYVLPPDAWWDQELPLKPGLAARPVIARAWDYAEETGQDVRDVYVRLLTVISMTSPEAVDAAFAEMCARGVSRD